MASAEGAQKQSELEGAGFNSQEISQWRNETSQHLADGGFSNEEIGNYFGDKTPNMKPIQQHFETNLTAFHAARAEAMGPPEAGAIGPAAPPPEPAKDTSIPGAAPLPLEPPKTQGAPAPKPAATFLESVEAGYQMSVTGLIARNKAPDLIEPQDAPRFYKIASQVASLAGDLPAMLAGEYIGGMVGAGAAAAVAGPGAPIAIPAGAFVGAAGGTFALPVAMRKILMDSYEKGDVKSFGDFWDRSASTFIETSKAFATGVATMGVGKVAGKAFQGVGAPIVKTLAEKTAEVATMVNVGNALEGKTTEPDDYINAAIVIGGLGMAGHVAGKLRSTYVKTGLTPDQIAEHVKTDPVLKQELLSSNIELPTAYKELVDPEFQGPPEPPKAQVPESLRQESTVLNPEFGPEQVTEVAAYQPKEIKPSEPKTLSPAEQRIQDRIGKVENPGLLDKIKNLGDKDWWDELLHTAYTNVVDMLHPVERLTKKLAGGENLDPLNNPILLLRNSRGDFGRVQQAIEKGMFDFKNYKTITKGLPEILKPVSEDLDGFIRFAVAKRTIEVSSRGIETGIDLNDAKEVAGVGLTKYQKTLDNLVDFQNAGLKYLLDSGVIKKDSYEAMVEAGKSYISMKRFMEEGPKSSNTGSKTGVKNPLKSLKGSERQIVNPIQSAIENITTYITMAERNRATKALVDLSQPSDYGPSLFTKVKTQMKAIEVSSSEAQKILDAHGIDADAEAFDIFRPQTHELAKDEISIFRNGKKEVYKVPEAIATAIKTLDPEINNTIIKYMSKMGNVLQKGATLSPDFIARNLSRDMQSAFILGKGFFSPIDAMSGLRSYFKKDASFENWRKSGGANASFIDADVYFKEHILGLSKEAGLMDKSWNVIRHPLDAMAAVSELVENGTRLGEFKRVAKGSEDISKILEAGSAAREVTLDFARRGAKTQSVAAIIKFWNANIQGLDKVARTIAERPVETLAKMTAAITAPSLALWWANHDDERYKELPRWQKDLFWIVLTKDHIFRIPKPEAPGILFGSLPERAMESFFTDNPKAFSDFQETMVQTFTPNYVPTALGPVLAHYSNKNSFTGGPLVPKSVEGLLPEYRYSPGTSETAIQIGKLIGGIPGQKDNSFASPAIIENYVQGWGGSMGKYALNLSDQALIKSGVIPDPIKPQKDISQYPIVKAFMIQYPTMSAQSIQDFYDNNTKVNERITTIKALAKRGDFDASMKEQNLALSDNLLFKLDGTEKAITTMHAMIQNIEKDPTYSPKEKRDQIDTLLYNMINAAKEGNKLTRELEKSLK